MRYLRKTAVQVDSALANWVIQMETTLVVEQNSANAESTCESFLFFNFAQKPIAIRLQLKNSIFKKARTPTLWKR